MTKFAPTSDDRNKLVTVFDRDGKPHDGYSLTNAREMVAHVGWTMDPAEAAARRDEPLPEFVHINDGQPKPLGEQAQVVKKPEAPAWEELTSLGKETLRAAAAYLKVADIDGRTSEKRIVAAIDTTLDQRLAATGDFDGSAEAPRDATDEVKAEFVANAVARRRRAFALEAKNAGLAFGDEMTLAALVGSLATLAAS